MAIALTNALFKVSQANGCLLFGMLSEDYARSDGLLFSDIRLYTYLPTLPTHAANLSQLRRPPVPPSAPSRRHPCRRGSSPVLRWQPPVEETTSRRLVHFAPLADQFGGVSFTDDEGEAPTTRTRNTDKRRRRQCLCVQPQSAAASFVESRTVQPPLPDYVAQWDQRRTISAKPVRPARRQHERRPDGRQLRNFSVDETTRGSTMPCASGGRRLPDQAVGMDVRQRRTQR